jgi:DNA-binding response OmpR family regulator
MANVLVINADPNLKRLIKLALPGMEHVIRHSADLKAAHDQSTSSPIDLVIARLVAADDQGPDDLLELRQVFATVRLIITAALHSPDLEGEKFQRLVRELQIEHCLIEPYETGSILQAIQAALVLPRRA